MSDPNTPTEHASGGHVRRTKTRTAIFRSIVTSGKARGTLTNYTHSNGVGTVWKRKPCRIECAMFCHSSISLSGDIFCSKNTDISKAPQNWSILNESWCSTAHFVQNLSLFTFVHIAKHGLLFVKVPWTRKAEPHSSFAYSTLSRTDEKCRSRTATFKRWKTKILNVFLVSMLPIR